MPDLEFSIDEVRARHEANRPNTYKNVVQVVDIHKIIDGK